MKIAFWPLFLLMAWLAQGSSGAFANELQTQVQSNGFREIYWQAPAGEDTGAQLTLFIRAGSLQERENELGYAHFVEHMAFNGTRDYPKDALREALNDLGLSIGQHTNASTGFSVTQYRISLDVVDEARLAQAVALLAQWARYVEFSTQEVEKEKPVILEEWRLSEPKDNRWQAQLRKALYADSRFALRKPIGTVASIQQATAKGLAGFYKRWYQPHNAALIVAGKIDIEKVKPLVAKHFSSWQSHSKDRSRDHDINVDAQRQHLTISDTYATGTQLSLQWLTPYQWPRTVQALLETMVPMAALRIAEYRMQKRLIQSRGAISRAHAYSSTFSPTVQSTELTAELPTGDIGQGLRLLAGIWQGLLKQGVTEDEFEQWRAEQISVLEQTKDSAQRVTQNAIEHLLYGSPLLIQPLWQTAAREFLKELTPTTVNAAIRQKYAETPRAVIVHSKAETPWTQARLDKALAQAAPIQAEKSLTEKDESWAIEGQYPAKLKATHEHGNGITEWVFDNGLRVVHRHSAAEPGNVSWFLNGDGGHNLLTQSEALSARLAIYVLTRSGARGWDGPSLNQWLDQKGIAIYPFFQFLNRGVRGSGRQDSLALQWRLLYVLLTEAQVNDQAWQHTKAQIQAELTQLEASPQYPWLKMFSAHVHQGDAGRRHLAPEEVKNAQPKAFEEIYHTYFSGAQNYVLSITGDISKQAALQAAMQSVAMLTPLKKAHAINRAFPREQKPLKTSVNGSGQRNVFGTLRVVLEKDRLAASYPTLKVYQRWLNDHLTQRVREENGWVYSIEANISGQPLSKDAWILVIEFASDPDNAQKVLDLTREILTELPQQLPTIAQIARWQKAHRDEAEKALSTDIGNQAFELAFSPLLGQSFSQALDAQWLTRTVSKAQLQSVAEGFVSEAVINSELLWLP